MMGDNLSKALPDEVAKRLLVLREVWDSLDAAWAALGDETSNAAGLSQFALTGVDDDQPGVQALPQRVRLVIRELWGTTVLSGAPRSQVTQPFPFAAAAETLGPGLRVWSLTAEACFRFCRTRRGRGALDSLSGAIQADVDALVELGTPVNLPALLRSLREATTKLRVLEDPWIPAGEDVHFQVTSGAPLLAGLDHLAAAATQLRRSWSEKHLVRYLELRWETDREEAVSAVRAGRPTRTASLRRQAPVAARWFAGDLAALGDALGIASLERPHPVSCRLVPEDAAAFRAAVLKRLHGPPDDPSIGLAARRPSNRRREIADMAVEVLQEWEARQRAPRERELRRVGFRAAEAFGLPREEAFQRFLHVLVEAARAVPGSHSAPPPAERKPPHSRRPKQEERHGGIAQLAQEAGVRETDKLIHALIVLGARVRGHQAWKRAEFLARAEAGAQSALRASSQDDRALSPDDLRVIARDAARRALAEAAAAYISRSDIPDEVVRQTVGGDRYDRLMAAGGPDAAAKVRTQLGPEAWEGVLELHPGGVPDRATITPILREALCGRLR